MGDVGCLDSVQPLAIEELHRGDFCLVRVGGEIDMSNVQELRNALRAVLDRGCYRLVVDLSDVVYIDSIGLGVFVGAINRIRQNGGRLCIIAASKQVKRVITVVRFEELIPVYETEEEAIRFILTPPDDAEKGRGVRKRLPWFTWWLASALLPLLLLLIALLSPGRAPPAAMTLSLASAPEMDPTHTIAQGLCDFLASSTGIRCANSAGKDSVSDILSMQRGEYSSAIVRSDTASYAYRGSALFTSPVKGIRGIATLYPMALHLVTIKGRGVRCVEDLAHRRIAVGRRGSQTERDALLVLEAAGMRRDEVAFVHLDLEGSVRALARGSIDAFFSMSAYPIVAVGQLRGVQIVPLGGAIIDRAMRDDPLLHHEEIPGSAYQAEGRSSTIGVRAVWLINRDWTDDSVYLLTRTLWEGRKGAFFKGLVNPCHPMEMRISLERALDDMTVPLHPGAARYYQEKRMIEGGQGAL